MSIIHDALKKVQQTQPGTPTSAPSRPPERQPPTTPEKQNDGFNIPLFVAALCAVIAMIFAALPYAAIKMNQQPPQPQTAAQAPAAVPRTTVTPAIKLPTPATMVHAITRAVTTPIIPSPQVLIPTNNPSLTLMNNEDPIKNIQVEGVLDMGGKKAVLINGNIYEEGHTIYGKTIAQITFNTLTIIDNGQKRTISIKP